jgi:hypothetical protein
MAQTKKKAAGGRGKVRVNLWLDGDVVEYFKGRARVPGAAKYQTQINAELRSLIEGDAGPYAALLKDEKFIAAVAERVSKLWRGGRGK